MSEKTGQKIHLWQKHIIKENDVKFYKRLLKDTKHTKFMFMEAHKELVEAFKNEKRMIFKKWNSMPVTEFLEKCHLFLYRTSNAWRDNYPRVLAEALAAGIPALVEPRDGCKDRVVHGLNGLYCIDYDAFLYGIKLLQRKEDMRHAMGMTAKDWAKENLDPSKWIDIIENLVT
jgi:glycosyltransferase involved in cell wall biosynthesis